MLTQERLKELLNYDEETGLFTRKKALAAKGCSINKIAGCLTVRGYWKISIDKKQYTAHRLAWFYVNGCFPESAIDHINGIKTDNKISNLRLVTHSENLQNIYKSRKNNKTSKTLGVSWYKRDKKWQAEIQVNKKRIHLGRYDSLSEAKNAYLSAKNIYHISQIKPQELFLYEQLGHRTQ
jgi:hypothetical protein